MAHGAVAQEVLSCGAALQRSLAAGAVETYELPAQSTGPVVIEIADVSSTIGLLKLRASGPDGVTETCSGTLQLDHGAGTTIEVSDCLGKDSGQYTITANAVAPSADYCARALTCGATADGVGFATPGEVDSYEILTTAGTTYTLAASNVSASIGALHLRVYDPTGSLVSHGDSCSGSVSFTSSSGGVYTLLASACDGPRTGDYRITRSSGDCEPGPVITSFVVASADDIPLNPAGFDDGGRPVFVRQFGRGFSLVIEAHPGSDRAAVGNSAYDPDGLDGLPDLQVLLSHPIGNGSPAVCDATFPLLGGVPAASPFAYFNTTTTVNAINDFGCRVSDGVGNHLGRGSALDACTVSDQGFGFGFVDSTTTMQFCASIQTAWAFPPGDTVVMARVRNRNGVVGAARQIVVRILNGTPGPAHLVADIAPGLNRFDDPATPQHLVAAGSALYFTADDGTHGVELWRSDGTAAETRIVKDIRPGSDSSAPDSLVNVNGTIFFTADDGVHGRELWKSDGTDAGTELVADLSPGADSTALQNLTAVGDLLYFTAESLFGVELWMSDGTDAGTVLVKDINPGAADSRPSWLTPFKGALYFAADDGQTGVELWRSDGSSAGTVRVADINPGSASAGVQYLTQAGSTLFFGADDGQHGQELWRTDGTSSGTRLVKNIFQGTVPDAGSNPQSLTNVNGTLFFAATSLDEGTELWRSDGTEAGTVLVSNIDPRPQSSSSPQNLTAVGNTLFFTADDGAHGRELWRSNGTAATTTLVRDIVPGPPSGSPSNLINAQGALLFSASDGTSGVEPWRSDGTESGTIVLQDINSGPASSDPGRFTVVGNNVDFVANNGQTGFELWTVSVPTVAQICSGDCNRDGTVSVDELVRAVAIALGMASVDDCSPADTDGNGVVTVDELVQAVNSALNGCS
ncbi:MAG TPA: ELWxxDGT repeat protein [Candidatus Binatia bacterium]|nr:ELWxxDGT repeat protein [Candidatus Binatia bacterium]